MKYVITLFFTILLISCSGVKSPINTNGNGFVAEGYDVTEYFNNKAIEGNNTFTVLYEGARYRFTSVANKSKFEKKSN